MCVTPEEPNPLKYKHAGLVNIAQRGSNSFRLRSAPAPRRAAAACARSSTRDQTSLRATLCLDRGCEQEQVCDLGDPGPREPEHPRRVGEVIELAGANAEIDLVGERKQSGRARCPPWPAQRVLPRETRPLESYGQGCGPLHAHDVDSADRRSAASSLAPVAENVNVSLSLATA